MIRKILVAVDHSSCADRALRFAASLARTYHAQVCLVHAFRSTANQKAEVGFSGSLFETKQQALALAEEMSRVLSDLGVSAVETEVREGPASHVILGAAESYQPDVLVLGARGSSTWTGGQLGSVSMAVVQRASLPVMVVR